MSKKGENIYKRKDGRWEGRYIRLYDENGKSKYGYVSVSYTHLEANLTLVDWYAERNFNQGTVSKLL